jgi:LCP family protein required for cell wall assembly
MRRRRRASFISFLLIVALIAGGVMWFRPWQLFGGAISGSGSPNAQEEPTKTVNILVMGVDARPGDRGRSDTMVLVNLNPATKAIKMMSIPRDTLIELPKRGDQKINAAYAYGGMELAKETVSELVGMPVQYGVVMNLEGFAEIIDLVGGVTVDVEQKMVYDDPAQNLHIRLSKGVQHMDGQHALWYMRWRSDGKGDIGRISRQQKLFAALADQVLTPAILPRVPALVAKVNKIITTDVPLTMQVKLALSGYTAIKAGMPTVATVPGAAKMIDGISYWVPDTSALHQMLQTWSTPS